ncbi:MAG TPA: thioesterase family protein [Clostridiaceae bacterium]
MYVSETKIKVRYVETDKMGIVHHSNYYIWFEASRDDFITEAGFTYRDMEAEGIMMPLIETSCRYHLGAKYLDEVIVETSIKELTPIKVIFNYRVLRALDKKLLATGNTTQTFVDESFHILNIKKKRPELWEKLTKLL